MSLTPQSNFSDEVIFLFILLNTFVIILTFFLSAFSSDRNVALIRSIAASSISTNDVQGVRSLRATMAPVENLSRN